MSVSPTTEHEHKILIGGDWKTTDEKLQVRSPQGGLAGTTFLADSEEIEEAVQAAERGYEVMKSLPSYKRSDLLRSIVEKIKVRKEEFAKTITMECGKPIKDSRAEVDRAIMTFTIASEEAKRLQGEMIPLDLNQVSEGRIGVVRRFPIGPVLGITPFNFPLNLVAHKVAPALAAGNSIIVKPSTKTPLTSLLLGEAAQQSGAPSGAINVVPCSNELTQTMVVDDRLKALTFTGGTEVGWSLKAKSGKKRVLLELGGNAAAIIDKDTDIEFAASKCASGAFYYAGQSCISVQRMYIHRSIYDQFLDRFISMVKHKQVGDPMDEATDIGPMIDEDAAKRIEQWVNEAVSGGGKILTGGHRDGAMYEPTVLSNVDPDMKISCLEAFGPVVLV
ncbi:MAG TPA: aldehyde dehydrogenase family protein, partial [Armatimonadota bacterium]|nr:aldehyde dehydrogenase family protein [Armatimonadota bacterium]